MGMADGTADDMAALRAHARGGPEKLGYERIPRPQPGPGEILIAVRAAAITFAELTWDETWTHIPATPSHEFSGTVAALGPDGHTRAIGDPVYGLVPFDRNGAAAQYVAVPERDVATKPTSVDDVVAAALPLAGLTAWQALVDHAQLQPGESILVQGGAGGVGGFVVQLAAVLGARVHATALPADHAHVVALGAERVYTVDDSPTDRYDVIVDTIGNPALEQSYAAAGPGSRLITLSGPADADRLAAVGARGTFFVVEADRTELEHIAALVDAGRLQVQIAATFPLADGRAAFESGLSLDRPPGKTVLIVTT
jgi:NADPH:quinone reductase-like Zn-dependent oxidoreductase